MINCSISLTPFPVCHIGGSERRRREYTNIIGRMNDYDAKINVIEYGRLSSVVWDSHNEDNIYYRNHGRHVKVHYDTSCVPLLPPNTATIYDHTPNYEKEQVKYIVDRSFRYFKSNYYHTHIPVTVMIEQLIHEVKTQKEIHSFRPCQGSILSYITSWTNTINIEGYLLLAGGPNLNQLNIIVLIKPSSTVQMTTPPSYQYYGQSYIRLGYAEAFNCPGQIREITVIRIQERMMVGVRCNNHFLVFEGPTLDDESQLQMTIQHKPHPLFMACPPVKLLKSIIIHGSSVLTSSIVLSPFIYGEVIFVTESGGVYLWMMDYEVTTIQSPLSTFDVSHYWQCVYGPHPRLIILAEHTGVSLINFINDTPSYKMLINKDSPYLIDSGITCIARHPLNLFYLFIAIGELLLLYDTRQTTKPLLEIRHEHFKIIRFIDVICCPWQPCTSYVMLSTIQDSKVIVYVIKGGYSFDEGQDPPPPYIGTSPHAVDTFTQLLKEINVVSPPINWRLTQSLAGACLIPLCNTKQFCGLTISNIGDIFLQVWHYEEHPVSPSVVPHLPKEMALWIEEVLSQNKILEQMYETNNVGGAKVTWNFSSIMNYISSPLADKGICPRCCVLLSNGGPLQDILLPVLPSIPKSILNGTANVWECHCCHDNITISRELSKHHANDQADITDSIIILDQLLTPNGGIEPPLFDYEEINRLWKLWEDNDDSIEEQIGTTHGTQQQSTPLILSQSIKQENFIISSQECSSQTPSQPIKKAKLKRRVGF